MKISDELREFAYLHFSGIENIGPCDALMSIADRIEAEMLELPKGADGKIWTGGELCFWTGAGRDEYHSFHDLVLRPGGWYVEDDCGNRYAVESVWHERQDSLERIADELKRYANDSCSEDEIDGMTASTLVDFADRIRKLAAKEDK